MAEVYSDKDLKANQGEDRTRKVDQAKSNSAREAKQIEIREACIKKDIDALVRLANSSGGLLNDSLRRTAWPLFLGCDQPSSGMDAYTASWRALPRHRDEDQVQLDVNRAFTYYPNNETEKEISDRKSKLSNLIVQILRQHPMLCYFQGYHDIVQVLLLVLGESTAAPAVARISLLRIRDYMLPTLSPALKHLRIIPAILELADPELAARLSQTGPIFALAATLTLYAHDIEAYSDIARLFDFILAHEPVMSIYLFAAIIISRRPELLHIPIDEPEMLHYTLSKLPQPLDLEGLISSSLDLFRKHPPEKLPHFLWWRLSSNSVLKTARSLNTKQTLAEGEMFFRKQAQQLEREELCQKFLVLVWKYRRPVGSVVAALLVGAVSIWLRRNGHDTMLRNLVWKVQGMTNLK